MAGVGVAEGLAAGTEKRDRSFEVASVCHHPRHDESALDENLSVHALLSQRIPKCQDRLVATERPFAVGNHRMLVKRPRQIVKGPQLPGRLPPTTESVQSEAVELSNGPDLRSQPGQHPQLRERLGVPVALVRTGCDPKASLQPGSTIRTDRSPQLPTHLQRQIVVFSPFPNAPLAFRFALDGLWQAMLGPNLRLGRLPLLAAVPRNRTAGAPLSRNTAWIGHDRERYPRSDATMPTRFRGWALFEMNSGDDLLSQGVSPQVPSARAGLTSVFGMGTGVTLPL